jgi:hypothetical protein
MVVNDRLFLDSVYLIALEVGTTNTMTRRRPIGLAFLKSRVL